MKFNLIESKEILDFENEINHELVVTERDISARSSAGRSKYYARFDNSDVLVGDFLMGECGDGNTIDEALSNYCLKISNRTIVFNACDRDKREKVTFPHLKHTKSAPKP